jgi:translation initiation factor 1 (eIF-1/SUI1)
VRQFIVAIHENIEAQNVWRSGVIIHKREYANTRAEVIENYGKREIKIRVSGKNKRDLLTIVTHELDKIHNSYKRLADKYQKLIPCNCNTCKGSQNPHFYEFANLKRRYQNRKYTVECDISYQDVHVLGLINDMGGNSQLQDLRSNYDVDEKFKFPLYIKSSWAFMTLYLLVFIAIVNLTFFSIRISISLLIFIVIFGIIPISFIGAFQLRQDERLSELSFMELVKLVISQLPIISTISRKFFRDREND